MSGPAHQDVVIWSRELKTPQPEWSDTLDFPAKGSAAEFACWYPEHDYGQIRDMEYLGDGVWVSASNTDKEPSSSFGVER